MPITPLNPDGLPKIPVYQQVSIATGSKLVFIAGQPAWNASGLTVGAGDLAAQVEQTLLNVGTALAGAGASFKDVAKLTIYVVGWSPDKMPIFLEGAARAATRMDIPPTLPPNVLLGVAALPAPDYLVEIEAIAVIS